jgi:DNA invertase Pin-like site-specific DNA recombinase
MTNTKEKKTKAIGYIRVSTAKQDGDNQGLEKQAGKIRESCAAHGFELLAIHEDTGSAVGAVSDVGRFGLGDTIKAVLQEDAVLVVTDPSRLFRDAKRGKEIFERLKVKVFSVKHGRVLRSKELLAEFDAAEKVAENIALGTKRALSKKAAKGVTLGSPSSKQIANRASVRVRKLKSHDFVEQVAHVLESEPAFRTLTHSALADLLNRKGFVTSRGIPLTAVSVRRYRREAEKVIAEREELERELDLEPFDISSDDLPGADEAVAPSKSSPAAEPVDDDESGEEAMRRLPHFGMFS